MRHEGHGDQEQGDEDGVDAGVRLPHAGVGLADLEGLRVTIDHVAGADRLVGVEGDDDTTILRVDATPVADHRAVDVGDVISDDETLLDGDGGGGDGDGANEGVHGKSCRGDKHPSCRERV